MQSFKANGGSVRVASELEYVAPVGRLFIFSQLLFGLSFGGATVEVH
jgi:hypothetical protein